uniref:Uncharacterized protein n=1 Tax=Cyprinus carpio TaxID=7962 RepID=A0A8C1Y822_CYPCA
MWLNNYPKQPQILQGLLMLNVSVKIGEELKLDVLLPNADKVETNSSGEWTEVWKRGHGVCCERMTDRDGNLTIKEFTSNDTGTYRVLDSEGETLITQRLCAIYTFSLFKCLHLLVTLISSIILFFFF